MALWSFLSSRAVHLVNCVAILPTHLSISGFAMRAAYIVVIMMDAAVTLSCLSSGLVSDDLDLEVALQAFVV